MVFLGPEIEQIESDDFLPPLTLTRSLSQRPAVGPGFVMLRATSGFDKVHIEFDEKTVHGAFKYSVTNFSGSFNLLLHWVPQLRGRQGAALPGNLIDLFYLFIHEISLFILIKISLIS